jgi:hypothetical protein
MEMHLPAVVADPEPVAELDRLGDQIAELSAHLDAATARLLDLIREFDARGGWNSGFRSCADWLSWRVGLDLGAARERVRVARALGALPRIAQALARGEVSYSKVRAITRVATPENEVVLLGIGRGGPTADVERIVRGWRSVDRKAEAEQSARRHNRRALQVYQDDDGMVVIRGRLAPEVGALVMQALAAAREALYQRARREASAESGEAARPPLEQQQADALALVAETTLHHGIDPGVSGERYQVVVHVDAPTLADPDQPGQSVLEHGAHVSAETSRRLACDASRVVMRHDEDGDRRSHADDSPGVASRAPRPRSRLPLPRVHRALRPGTSHPPLGARRPHHALQPRASLPATSSNGPRGGLPGRTTPGWCASLSEARRRATARRPAGS